MVNNIQSQVRFNVSNYQIITRVIQYITMQRAQKQIHKIQGNKDDSETLVNSSQAGMNQNYQFSLCQSIEELNQESYHQTNRNSHIKQNKDGANAARTARIVLMSKILEENQEQITNIFKTLKDKVCLKKLMLNIGQKSFKDRFLFKPELREYFDLMFQKISKQDIQTYMRKNRRSNISYNTRLELCYKYVLKYEQSFYQKFQKKPSFIISIPLKPETYRIYMQSKVYGIKSL